MAQLAQSDFVAYIISVYPPALNVAGNHIHFKKVRKVSSVNSRQKELQGATHLPDIMDHTHVES